MQTIKNKHAICLLAFINEVYLVGVMVAGYIHKQYIIKNNLEIDLVLMIDKTFEKYIDELYKIFNKVKVIDLVEINLSVDYKIHKKYSGWLKYSINKWQVLNFDEYEKILFCDTEILPLSKNWYNKLFDLQAPSFLSKGQNDNYSKIIMKDSITNKQLISSEDYRTSSKDFKFTIDAGLVLLKPDKQLYLEYLNFVKFAEGSEGYISSKFSGADETTLLLFTIFYKNIECRSIPYNYAVITWENHPYDKNKIEGLNFLSYIKPWVKPELIQWSEERIWNCVADSMFSKYYLPNVENIFFKLQIENLFNYSDVIKKKLTDKIPYNYEAYTENKLKNQTIHFLHFLKNIKKNNKYISYDSYNNNDDQQLIIFKILYKAKKISDQMLTYTEINQVNLKKNIC